MNIVWNKITWYSKLLAVVLFVTTFFVAFYFGIQYQKITSTKLPTEGVFVLGIGDIVELKNLNIKLDSLVEDSRCPDDVQCIQAGRAKFNFIFSKGEEESTKSLSTDDSILDVYDYHISLLEVLPVPKSTKQPKVSDYTIKLHVEKI